MIYKVWNKEKENQELQPLNREFYVQIGKYVNNLIEETKDLDQKTFKFRLISKEKENINKLLTDLLRCRYIKIINRVLENKMIPPDILTPEEEISYTGILSTWKHCENVLTSILKGKSPKVKQIKIVDKPKRILVRFLKAIPTFVGPEMKTYGPFKEEEVASLLTETAEALIKRGIVVEVKK